MTREQILECLLDNAGSGLWIMAALKLNGKPINKVRLREITNSHFLSKNSDAYDLPIRSRHTLDQMTARLEGAGLVEILGVGRAKMYTLSELGHEIIRFSQLQERER